MKPATTHAIIDGIAKVTIAKLRVFVDQNGVEDNNGNIIIYGDNEFYTIIMNALEEAHNVKA